MVQTAKKYAGKVKFVGVAVSCNQSPERVKLYAENTRYRSRSTSIRRATPRMRMTPPPPRTSSS